MNDSEYARLDGFYRDRVAGHDEQQPGYAATWAEFVAQVLAHGGQLVVPPLEPEVHLELLTARLRAWDGENATMMKGQPSQCHGNSAELWLTERVEDLATGYALSEDGLWRQHTWALAADGTVVETTVARVAYAGFVLSESEAVVFAAANVDEGTFADALLAGGRTARIAKSMLADAEHGARATVDG